MSANPFYQPPSQPGQPFEATTEWLRGEGEAHDVVLSSRVRLARNLAGAPFAAKSGRKDRLATLEACRNQVLRAGLAERLVWIDLHEAPMMQRRPIVTSGPITQCGPMVVPSPMRAAGCTLAEGSIDAGRGSMASTSSASATT